MAEEQQTTPSDPYKEKFRPDQQGLDQEVDAALSGVPLDDLMGLGEGSAPTAVAATVDTGRAPPKRPRPEARGIRVGKVVAVTPDDIVVDFGGKDAGVAPRAQWEIEP